MYGSQVPYPNIIGLGIFQDIEPKFKLKIHVFKI